MNIVKYKPQKNKKARLMDSLHLFESNKIFFPKENKYSIQSIWKSEDSQLIPSKKNFFCRQAHSELNIPLEQELIVLSISYCYDTIKIFF